MILVDSSCWIEYFRPGGNPVIQEQMRAWLAADEVATCGPVVAEVLRGVRKPDLKRVRRLFSALHYLESTDQDWRVVTDQARALADRGENPPLLDILIAAIAERCGAALAHADGHFTLIADVMPLSERSFL